MSIFEMKDFKQPPTKYKTAPLWVWNDDMTSEIICKQLLELKNHGFGGVFLHPRPGLSTEYLSDNWFEQCKLAIEEAKRLGMKVYLYDENSYPSGFAGGHVSSELPDCLAEGMVMRVLNKEQILDSGSDGTFHLLKPGHPIVAFSCEKDRNSGKLRLLREVTVLPVSEWAQYGDHFIVIDSGAAETNPWLAGYAYVDLMRPEVGKRFLETTHQKYYEKFGEDFGTWIPAFFTDEPQITAGKLFHGGEHWLAFSFWFAEQFERRNGYSLTDHLPCLFADVEGELLSIPSTQVRFDYYCTIRELWVNSFIKPLSEWCEEKHISFTGHYMEHTWPYPWSSPAVMSLYEYMHWPAIDNLMGYMLLETGTEPLMLTIREAQSAANQFNRERVLCEAYGAGGWDSSFADYKRIGDWLMVHGINFINQHLTYSTIVGARKRDHPQSFDWRQPWWDEYGLMNEYYGRLSYALSQGVTKNRILLLHPTTTAFMETPANEWGRLTDKDHRPPENPDMSAYLELIQWLADKQWDYDLGDEFIIENNGSCNNGKMTVAAREYDYLIVPGNMKNMKRSTVKLLATHLANRGRIAVLGEPGGYVDGRLCEEFQGLTSHSGCVKLANLSELENELWLKLKPRLYWEQSDEVLPAGLAHLRRELADGSLLYFVVNSAPQAVKGTICLEGLYIEGLNPWNGEKEDIRYQLDGNKISVAINLHENDSRLFRVYNQMDNNREPFSSAVNGVTDKRSLFAHSVSPLQFELDRHNVLPLTYCDLTVGQKSYPGIQTIKASELVSRHHGFKGNPWDNAVQYKTRTLDREPYPANSGFDLTYHFDVANYFHVNLMHVIVEGTANYAIQVNGVPTAWQNERPNWLDHKMIAADIGHLVLPGHNTVKLIARPYSVHSEVEAIYLRGIFGVYCREDKWLIDEQRNVMLGNWTEQGYPFYEGNVLYKKSFVVAEQISLCKVALNRWNGSAACVYVNDQIAGLIDVWTGNELDITAYVHAGENEITLRICGNMKNLLGPHHDPVKPRRIAWPGNWKKAPIFGPPLASMYDLISYGLMDDFKISFE